MDLTNNDRLILLVEGGVISNKVRLVLLETLPLLEKELNLSLETSSGSMLVTHLASMLARAEKGELINNLPQSTMKEIEFYPEALEHSRLLLTKVADQLNLRLPESEIFLVAAYLAVLNEQEMS